MSSVNSDYHIPFNSQPHTRLTGLSFAICSNALSSFNSQPHTRLTYHVISPVVGDSSFNSQPHTRLTFPPLYFTTLTFPFQFTASYEADPLISASLLSSLDFQFTASYEADLLSSCIPGRNGRSFNSQPHTRLTVLSSL